VPGLAIASTSSVSVASDTVPADQILTEATDLAGLGMFISSSSPGMVLGVVRGNATIVRGNGETEKGNNHEPDGSSLVRLNSITKVFTTEVLVSLVADGKLRLTDPSQQYAGDTKVPTYENRPVTLMDLAS
jgi:D-alanyl-D-alanine-carboxypeptidase/D-alanyl-D-alanine-endopeptidase